MNPDIRTLIVREIQINNGSTLLVHECGHRGDNDIRGRNTTDVYWSMQQHITTVSTARKGGPSANWHSEKNTVVI